ncbi:MAG: hypothetical protein HOI95_21300 [Chromatiales bacterium]|jgi:hypothetical protein|nr:hypothetical protein [Chromatiales bacterium]
MSGQGGHADAFKGQCPMTRIALANTSRKLSAPGALICYAAADARSGLGHP